MRAIKLILLTLVIGWGLMALLVRSATPFINDYRPTLEQSLSTQLNTPVAIGSMTARWYGLRPLIELNTVRVGEGEQQLTIDQASIDIDPAGLLGIFGKDLRAGLLQASRLTVEGLALTLIREPDGRLHLEGIGALGSLPEAQAANVLPRSLQLVDTRLVWLDRKTKAAPLIVPDVAIGLRRDNQRLELRARLETPAGSVDAAANLDGFLGTTAWSGESYLHVTDLDVAQVLAGYLPRYYGLQSLAINVTSWTRWKDARPVHSQGEFSLRKLRLAPTAAVARPLDIMAASAEFSIDRHDQQVLLGLKNLRVAGDRNWTAKISLWPINTTAPVSRSICDPITCRFPICGASRWYASHGPLYATPWITLSHAATCTTSDSNSTPDRPDRTGVSMRALRNSRSTVGRSCRGWPT